MKKIPIRKLRPQMKEPGFPERFNIRDLGAMLSGKDLVQELHRHDFFFILVLKKGSGTHEIDFIPYEVNDHTVFFMRPGQVHHLTLKAGSSGYLVGFSAGFYEADDRCSNLLLRKMGHMNYCRLDAKAFGKAMPALAAVFEEYSARQEGYEEVIKANLCIFFTELVRQRQGRNAKTRPDKAYARERLDEFLSLLEKHIAAHKQVTRYAELLNLSPYQLNTITKSLLGKTSSELINGQIILEARRNLLATSEQVKEIAYRLGYEDVSYFIRFFKKHTGYSPEAFRQHFR
jgi:AraC-like DNA-binding protein